MWRYSYIQVTQKHFRCKRGRIVLVYGKHNPCLFTRYSTRQTKVSRVDIGQQTRFGLQEGEKFLGGEKGSF